jgi:hypothetical protein
LLAGILAEALGCATEPQLGTPGCAGIALEAPAGGLHLFALCARMRQLPAVIGHRSVQIFPEVISWTDAANADRRRD